MGKIVTVKDVDLNQLTMNLNVPPTLFAGNQAISVERIDTSEYLVHGLSKKVLSTGDTIPFGTLMFKVVEEVARVDVLVEGMNETERGMLTSYRAERYFAGEKFRFEVRLIEYADFS